MICGGSEAAITPMSIGGFAAMKALSTRNDEPAEASRPFDVDRDGFIVGEGAGILILETLDHASIVEREFWRKSRAMECLATRITSRSLRKMATARIE